MDSDKIISNLLITVLREQRDVLEDSIRRNGPLIEDVKTLAALNEVIDYNTVPGEDEPGRERS